ncbi:MAG TPA: hypothetical protein PK438_07265, partial [Clostridia bacterium]|nr:hypothetical protein [Clostridia bacterium]
MGIMIISCAAFVFTLVLAVLDAPLSSLKAKERRVRAITEVSQPVFNDLEGNLFERMFGPFMRKMKQAQLARKAKKAGKGGNKQSASQEKLEKRLRAA